MQPKFYIITDNKGLIKAEFFETREEAEEYQEEHYYNCTGDVLAVPVEVE